jgi:hypothetical protein
MISACRADFWIEKRMPISQFRMLVVATFLPILCICFLPTTALAQFTSIAAIAGMTDAERQDALGIEERAGIITYVLEESRRGVLGRFFCEGEWYFSWGGSRQWWGNTNFHISQPSQGNNFTIYNVRGMDDPSWDGLLAGQYNIRFGRFINEARTLAVEFNFDHTKYDLRDGQTARVSGSIAGKPTDANFRLDDNFFRYQLHNGVNHVMVNLVKRVPLFGEINENFSVAAIGKVGVGLVVPHAANAVLGYPNDVGKKEFNNLIGTNRGWWQINGWTVGVEAGFRVVLWAPIYLEITDKIAFAQLSNVPVFQGTARHNLWMNEVIVSVGITFGGGR